MLKVFLAASVLFICVLGWGYWHAATHASLSLRVDDYGLKTDRELYGTPHHVTLTFYGAAKEPLAFARSVEPAGYLLAVHPDPNVGDCSQHQNSQQEYQRCFALHSAWASRWPSRVRTASAKIGTCVLDKLPVSVHSSNTEWLLWWVPLPHIGGIPRRYFELVVKVNTKSCTAA
jgi:hypothetical protein